MMGRGIKKLSLSWNVELHGLKFLENNTEAPVMETGAETGWMHDINISLLWSKYHVAKKKKKPVTSLFTF